VPEGDPPGTVPAMPVPVPVPLREHLRAALPAALKSGDRVAVAALRGALAALDNAEAVDPATRPDAAAPAGAIERSPVGAGAAEVPRRDLTAADVARVVRAEVTEREAAADGYERAGRPDQARRLRAEAAVLAGVLAEHPGQG
jgi:uncharacterized protein